MIGDRKLASEAMTALSGNLKSAKMRAFSATGSVVPGRAGVRDVFPDG